MYRRNRPVEGDRNNSYGKDVFTTLESQSLCVEPVLVNKLVEAYVPNNFAQKT